MYIEKTKCLLIPNLELSVTQLLLHYECHFSDCSFMLTSLQGTSIFWFNLHRIATPTLSVSSICQPIHCSGAPNQMTVGGARCKPTKYDGE